VTSEASPKFTVGQRIVLAIVPRIVWALLSVVGRTWHFDVIGEPGVIPVREGKKAGARDLLLLAPVRSSLCVLFSADPAR